MRPRNYKVYGKSEEELQRLAEEYRSMGRAVKIEDGILIVFALNPKFRKKREKPVDKPRNSR